MGYALRVFCRADSAIASNDVRNFIAEGAYFEQPPEIVTVVAKGYLWRLDVQYSASKRPIIVTDTASGPLLAREIAETLQVNFVGDNTDSVKRHISSARQILAIEIDREGLTDDGWVLCDCLQSFLASSFDGLVYAPDDGFYDSRLRKIAEVS